MRKPMMPMPAPAVSPVPPVKAAAPVVQPKAPAPVAQPSPMARQPVAKTQRVVPSVPTGRGVVRTDTHNQANQVPRHAKHAGRGKP